MIVLLTYPSAVELSTWMGERGCFHPISSKVFRRGTIACAVVYSAASSPSATEEYTDLRTADMDRTGPLDCGMGSPLDKKIWAPARLRDLDSLR